MQVVVAVVGGVEGGCDHGCEEVFGRALLLLQEDLVDQTFEDSPLCMSKSWSALVVLFPGMPREVLADGQKPTCQTKGKFFRFSSAKATTNRRNILPVLPVPMRCANLFRRDGTPMMAARVAPTLRVPAIMGRRWTADIVGRKEMMI